MATLLLSLDASNPSSWPYPVGGAPTPYSYWTDVSGASYFGYPAQMEMVNAPDLVTISGSTKGLRMRATSGGTYPNGSGIGQRGLINLGGNPGSPNGDIGTILNATGSYTVAMWICFNQPPIAGSGTGGVNMPTTIFSQFTNNPPHLIFGSSRGDSVQPRVLNEIAVQYYPNAGSNAVAGTWIPTVGVWYLVTIVCENTGSSSGTLTLYINGTAQGTATSTGALYQPFRLPAGAGSNYLWILNSSYYPNALPSPYDYGGDITFSTFKVFSGAMSSAEVSTMFAAEGIPFGYGSGLGPIYWTTTGYKLMQTDVTNFGRYVGATIGGNGNNATFTLAMMEYNYRSQWGT